MLKILLMFAFLFSFLVANDSDTECLCLKVDKKLAKELKELISKNGGEIKEATTTTVKVEKPKEKLDGKAIYAKCQACHGEKADAKAYGRSRPLNSLTLDEIKESLRGYQDGSYDRGMAVIMRPMAGSLVDSEVDAVYEYIQTLK